MGYIPLIIPLLAFVLLLIMVNVNSIQTRRQSMGLVLFTVCQTAKSRNALLKRLRGVPKNLLCPALPPNFRIGPALVPHVTSFITAEWASLEETSHLLKDYKATPDTLRYVQSLLVLNHRQRINLRNLERKVREYNKLINSQPTSMVAFLYRLKPIKLPAYRK